MTSQDLQERNIHSARIDECRKSWELERKKQFPNAQVHLDLAIALLHCPERSALEEAQDLLDELIEEGLCIDSACYAMAVCKFKLGYLTEAREYITRVLQLDPTNEQALAFQDTLDTKVTREGRMVVLATVSMLFTGVVLLHRNIVKPWLNSRR